MAIVAGFTTSRHISLLSLLINYNLTSSSEHRRRSTPTHREKKREKRNFIPYTGRNDMLCYLVLFVHDLPYTMDAEYLDN
jgi:hypothetical protein